MINFMKSVKVYSIIKCVALQKSGQCASWRKLLRYPLGKVNNWDQYFSVIVYYAAQGYCNFWLLASTVLSHLQFCTLWSTPCLEFCTGLQITGKEQRITLLDKCQDDFKLPVFPLLLETWAMRHTVYYIIRYSCSGNFYFISIQL